MSEDYNLEYTIKSRKGKSATQETVDERGPPKITIEPPAKSPSRGSKSRTSSDSSSRSSNMGEHRSSKHHDSKSSSKSSSKSTSKSSSKATSSKPEKDDWSEVNEPDERRRIQNRLAQRKFREKAKDQKESRDRDMENQLRAGYSYSAPSPDDLQGGYDLSGLPWGGPSMKHIVERGQAVQRDSQQGGSGNYSYHDPYRGSGSGSGRGSESR